MAENMDGQRFCPKCPDGGQWHPVDKFYTRKRKLKSGRTAVYYDSMCKTCKRAAIKDWKRRNPDKTRAHYEKHKASPKFRQYQREYYRMTKAKGAWTWSDEKLKHPKKDKDIRVNADPFAEWLAWAQKHLNFITEKEALALANTESMHGRWSWRRIAEELGIDQSTLGKIRDGRNKTVSLTMVDQVGHLLGFEALAVDLYPLGQEEEEDSEAA